MLGSRLRFFFVHSFLAFFKDLKKNTVASTSTLLGIVLKHTDSFTLWHAFSHIESCGHFFCYLIICMHCEKIFLPSS